MTILIDADGCPVVDITIKIAAEHKIDCVILCDTSHVFEKPGAKTITVSKGADSVDFALVNMVQAGDIVVTQDYGLAAMCLAKRAVPISQNGMVYSDSNIDALLSERHTAKKIRMAGGRLKGNTKRTPEQNAAFEKALRGVAVPMNRKELIDYCLTYPGAFEDYPFDEYWTCIRHRRSKKTFAFIYERGGNLCINLKCDPLKADFLRQIYKSFTAGYHMNKEHWNTVIIGGDVHDAELFDLIQHSYDLIKPKIKKKCVR